MRLLTINRLYDLRLFPIFAAICVIALFSLFSPVNAHAGPNVVNALEERRGDWRDYYRNKVFADMHSHDLMESLNAYVTEDPRIKEAIRLRLDGKWKESIDSLTGLTADTEVTNQEEIVYALGLIYESLAFFPEAMGNYDRLEFKRGESLGTFYYKTILRKSYVKFITGLKYSRFLSMIDADGGFYKVFDNSTDENDWSDALAGHALMLYFFGAHDNAEEIFKSVEKHGKIKPATLFGRAENYMNLGLHQEARVVFQKLLHIFEKSERKDLLSYIYLRLGDIANIRDEKDSALAFYKLIIPELEEGEKIVFSDPYIIQSMAVGEYFLKIEENVKGMSVFKMLSTGPMPIGLDLRESIDLNVVLLYHRDGNVKEAFEKAKEFSLLYPENPYINQVTGIINDTVYKFIAELYEGDDYHNVLYYYYENMGFIYEKRTLMIVGDLFLHLSLPSQAKRVFSGLWKKRGTKDYSDIELVTQLARSEAMIGSFSEASNLLTMARPKERSEREKVALGWRLLGDDYFRSGDKKGAIKSYGNYRAVLYDASIELRYASLLTSRGRSDDAITVYRSLLRRTLTDDTKGKALLGAAETYLSVGNWRRALINYQFALALSENRLKGEIHYKIGEANYKMGKNAQAIKAWKLAQRVDEQGYYKRISKERVKEVQIWEQARK